jgi:hypothetical protein
MDGSGDFVATSEFICGKSATNMPCISLGYEYACPKLTGFPKWVWHNDQNGLGVFFYASGFVFTLSAARLRYFPFEENHEKTEQSGNGVCDRCTG